MDATAQAAAVRSGDVSPAELTEESLARIDRLDPELHAVVHRLDDKARAAARGPLPDGPFRGVPILVKDLTAHSAGDPFHEGMRALRDAGHREPDDSFLVGRLRGAGFVLVGRTNTPEMGIVPTTEPLAYGATHNPWDTTRSAGGSSGGSGAAVAAGMVALAHGNDGGGSIRIPSSVCGLYGLKPSRGRTSLGPQFGEVWAGFEAEHVLTRSVRDSAGVLDVLAGPMPGDPYTAPPPARAFAEAATGGAGRLRIGVCAADPTGATEVRPECRAAVEATAALLEGLGHEVEESWPAGLAAAEFVANFITVFTGYVEWCLEDAAGRIGRPVDAAGCEPLTWALAEMSRGSSPGRYLAAVQALHAFGRAVRSWWEVDGWDLLLTPTVPEPAWPLGQFTAPDDNPLAPLFRAAQIVPFTAPFNVTGQPAASLPLHWSPGGLPVGVQLVGAYGREDVVLAVSAQLEEARPWAQRRPPVHGAG
ncbi:MAG: amidase [Acidobacteriota bacterium]|nr:amidase [Acidobacteriota bacterium]